jgi:predicted LPLAT superfamily acyltransferase
MKNENRHWSRLNEQAAGYWQLKFVLFLFFIFPVTVLRIIAFPVGFFYFLFSKRARTESKRYLQKIAPLLDDPKMQKRCGSFFGPLRHIVSFSLSLIEKLQSWGGKYPLKNIHFQDDDIAELMRELEDGKGTVLVFSHLGNSELLRGLLNLGKTGVSRQIPVTAVMDKKVNAHFTRMLNELNPRSGMDIIGADEIGPQTAVLFEEKLASGEMVVIAGDRTAAKSDSKDLTIPFLGKEAPFPRGVFYLAAMMKAPVYFVFSLRRKDLSLNPEYDMHVYKCPLSFDCSRKERAEKSSQMAQSFASYLEGYCKEQPFQWYNFFDFWQEGE